jgi:hypothetical protein
MPPEAVYAAMAEDLAEAQANRTVGRVAVRLNYEMSGARSLLTATARRPSDLEAPFQDALIEINPRWGEPRSGRRSSARVAASRRPISSPPSTCAMPPTARSSASRSTSASI